MKDQTVYQFAETSVTTPSGETNVRYVLSSIEDRNGNKTTYLYNGQGILDAIVFPGAQTVDFVIEDGLITEIKTPGERTTKLTHNSDGQLSQIVDPDGSSRSWSYLENNFIETETTKLGATYTYGYEAGRAATLNRSDSNQGRTEGQWTVQPVVTSGVRLNPNAELTEPNNAPTAYHIASAIYTEPAFLDTSDSTLDGSNTYTYTLSNSGLESLEDEVSIINRKVKNSLSPLGDRLVNAEGHGRVYEYDNRAILS